MSAWDRSSGGGLQDVWRLGKFAATPAGVVNERVIRFRRCRYAQPPANRCDPSGIVGNGGLDLTKQTDLVDAAGPMAKGPWRNGQPLGERPISQDCPKHFNHSEIRLPKGIFDDFLSEMPKGN